MKPYLVLARRYRPRTFGEVLGQEAVARTLVHAIETGRVAHAYLFSGPRGVGKTSMARILAKALCCLASEDATVEPCGECDVCLAVSTGDDLDVIEIDGASNRGIGEVRDLRDNARFAPARARSKIYVIDEVHMLTDAAFNALLKILEEPPEHIRFIFATTESHKVPATILSRCQRFDFRRIPVRTIAAHLKKICEAEGVTAGEDVLLGIARSSNGGMRDAQSLLDQMITLSEAELDARDLESLLGTVALGRMEQIAEAVGSGDAGEAVRIFEGIYERGIDPVEFLKQSLEAVRNFLVFLTCGDDTDLVDLTPEARMTAAAHAKAWGLPRVMYALGLLTETLKTVKLVGEGRALAELALVKLAGAGGLKSLDEIVKDLEALQQKVGRAPARAPRPSEPAPAESPEVQAVAPAREVLFTDDRKPEGALKGEDRVTLTMDRVKEAWSEVLDRVKRESSAVGSFLGSAALIGLTDRSVKIGFAPRARFQKMQLDDPDRIRVVETVLAEVLGQPMRLDCAVTDAVTETPQAEEESPAPEGEEPRGVSGDEIQKIGAEPIVNAIKELFMARLVNIERT